jgi:Pyridine nucleotide-disulphide oxidoreductase
VDNESSVAARGELGLLTGQPAFLTAVARTPGEVLVVPVERLRELVARDSVLGDLILRSYLIRRSLLIEIGAGLRLVGSHYSPNARRLREFVARNRVPHQWIDVERDQEAGDLLRELGISPEETPVVIRHGAHVLRNPSVEELARAVGLPGPEVGRGGLRPAGRRRRPGRAGRRRLRRLRRPLDDRARTVLIATGARYRKLDVPSLEQFEGTSVYYAATQIEARFWRNDPVVIVGGGNSAGQAALFLAEHAARVRLLIRHDDLGRDMSRYLVDRIERTPGIEVLLHTEVRELLGDDLLEGVVVEDNRTASAGGPSAASRCCSRPVGQGVRVGAHLTLR